MSKKAKRLLIVAATLLGLYFTGCAYLAHRFVNPPRRVVAAPPPGWTTIPIPTPFGVAPADVSPAVKSPPAVIILVHGYGGTRNAHRILGIPLAERDYFVINLQTRGQGDSPVSGVRFGLGESEEVLATIRWARTRFPAPTPILLYGASQGAAAVTFAAAKSRDQHLLLVLEDPFARLDWAVADTLKRPYLAPVGWFGQWSTGISLASVNPTDILRNHPRPTQLIFGEKDELFSPRHRALYEQLPGLTVHTFPSPHSRSRFEHPEAVLSIVERFVAESRLSRK